MKTIKYMSLDWEAKRTKVSDPVWKGKASSGPGVTLREVYHQPRAHRMIALFYSIWENGRGECIGEYYEEIREDYLDSLFAN